MKILLISPPALGLKDKIAYPPLGLMYLASNLEGDHDVEILNMITEEEKIDYAYDIYGISIHSPATYSVSKKIIRNIKENHGRALIVIGGAFSSNVSLDWENVDYVIGGEGEMHFSDYCNNKVLGQNEYGLIENLDSIKFPARHLLPREMIRYEGNVHHTTESATTILATRGCPYNCNFCDTTMWQRKRRTRSPENIAQEIEQVINEYGIKWFRFPDDCLTINKKWFSMFVNHIKQLDIKWTMLSRADTVDYEQLELAKNSGCQEVFFGIESGSQRILDLMNKKTTVKQNAKAIQLCRDVGIKSCVYIMFAFPGETEETLKETMDFLEKTKPDKSRIHQFLPIPNTHVWNNQEQYGIKVKGNFDDYWDFLDNPNLTLDYIYISNDRILKMKEVIKQFYKEAGYLDNLYV